MESTGFYNYGQEIAEEPYQCEKCGQRFYAQTGRFRIACDVAHHPEDCCHYGEKPATEITVDKS